MKKTFANLVQKSLVAALLVFGALLFSTSRAEAQGGAKDLAVNWVDAGEAMLRLETDAKALSTHPQFQFVGSDPYNKVHYYKAVHRRIAGGEPVRDAVINGIVPEPDSFVAAEIIPGVNLTQPQRQAMINTLTTRLSQ